MVRAKFQVQHVGRNLHGHSVRLSAVTGDSEENKSFWKYTPAGQIEVNVVSDETVALFGNPGDEFYVDFTPAG